MFHKALYGFISLVRLSARVEEKKIAKWLRSRPFLQLKRNKKSESGEADAPTDSRLRAG